MASLGVVAAAIFVINAVALFVPFPAVGDHTAEITLSLVALLVGYVVLERATVLRKIEDLVERSTIEILPTQEETYLRSAQALFSARANEPDERVISHMSLHPRGREETAFPSESPVYRVWQEAMMRRILEGWQYRWIVLVNDANRLAEIEKRMAALAAAPKVEIRAFVGLASPTNLSPLIIGKRHAFIAHDDTRHPKGGAAIHLTGTEVGDWLAKYFNDLWDDRRLYRLCDHSGAQEAEFARARRVLDGSAPN